MGGALFRALFLNKSRIMTKSINKGLRRKEKSTIPEREKGELDRIHTTDDKSKGIRSNSYQTSKGNTEVIDTDKMKEKIVKEMYPHDERDDNDFEDDNELVNESSESQSEQSNDDESNEDNDDSDSFEQQSSSDSDILDNDSDISEDSNPNTERMVREAEAKVRQYREDHLKQVTGVGIERSKEIEKLEANGELSRQQYLNVDDLSDDDDDNDMNRNTVGRIPLHWYDPYDHIGYNIEGKKLVKRQGKDRIDLAISANDPIASRTVYDIYNDREIVLSDRDLEIIRRIKSGAFAHPEHDAMPEYVDYFSSIKEIMPLSAAPEPKRRFLPSKWEMMKVMKIVKAMKEGRYIPIRDRKKKSSTDEVYQIWNDQEDEIIAESKRYQYHLPAPKMPLPGHAESYNPPSEYLLTNDELKQQEDLNPKERLYNFIPQKYSCLRHVPGYDNLLKERFERCLDLYLCPRKLKRRLNIDPESLVPKLPKPKDLKPFPNHLTLQYLGHSGAVRSIAISPDGQYFASGSDDGTVRLWEIDSTYCRHVWQLSNEPVVDVIWNPNPSHHIIVAATGNDVYLITTDTGDVDSIEITDALLSNIDNIASGSTAVNNDEDQDDEEDDIDDTPKPNNKRKAIGSWTKLTSSTKLITQTNINTLIGPRFRLTLSNPIKKLTWHYKGDYLGILCSNQGSESVIIYQLSKASSQCPFSKSPGNVQGLSFHPSQPILFISTQQHVKIYHLIEQKLIKKLLTGCKWISCLDIHPSGDHVVLGSYDRRVVWFDLDLATTPYKTLKFHEKAVRSVCYHKRYPLMASASDDGTVHVFHSMVYSDLSKNPMIVPLKILRGHGVKGDLGVIAIEFHPRQPWIITAGADGVINLFTDI